MFRLVYSDKISIEKKNEIIWLNITLAVDRWCSKSSTLVKVKLTTFCVKKALLKLPGR